MPDVLMPRLSDSMEEGTVVAWLVEDGATVAAGQEIVEIETDKATMAHTAAVDGVLRIVAPPGTTLPLGAPIARIQGAGEAEGAPAAAPVAEAPPAAGTPPGVGAAEAPGAQTPSPPGAGAAAGERRAASPADDGAARAAPRRRASPVARRIAGEHGIGLDALPGTGPQGRVTKRDVLDAVRAAESAAGPPVAAAGSPAPAGATAPSGAPVSAEDQVRDPSRIERLVAERMVQSRSEVPEFTVSVTVDMAAALAFRAELRDAVAGTDAAVPSVNDLIVKACGSALREHPRVNRAWIDDRIVTFGRVNVGVAVATDDGGLVVPVVEDVDRRSLGDLAATARALTGRARTGAARPDDFSGGTFTVSNLGMLGVSSFTAIITPGQGAILSVGAAEERFVAVDGQPVLRPVATLTLNGDHRVVYGADAARFLDHVRRRLEHPMGLTL